MLRLGLFPITVLLILTACSSHQKSKLLLTSGAFIVGAAIGNSTAPADERKELHAAYWGSILALTANISGDYIYSEESRIKRQQLEIDKLNAQIDFFKNGTATQIKEGKGYFKNSSSPNEDSIRINNKKWKLYKIDSWVKDGPNKLYHQDRLVEITDESAN